MIVSNLEGKPSIISIFLNKLIFKIKARDGDFRNDTYKIWQGMLDIALNAPSVVIPPFSNFGSQGKMEFFKNVELFDQSLSSSFINPKVYFFSIPNTPNTILSQSTIGFFNAIPNRGFYRVLNELTIPINYIFENIYPALIVVNESLTQMHVRCRVIDLKRRNTQSTFIILFATSIPRDKMLPLQIKFII